MPPSRQVSDVRILLLVAARMVLAGLAGLVIFSLIAPLAGGRSNLVLSASMAPALDPGDLAITRPAASIRAGQIILFTDPAHPGRNLIHRVLRAGPDGLLITRGDANLAADSTPVPRSAVLGVLVARLPWIGRPALWLRHHQFLPLAGSALAALALATLAQDPRRSDPRSPQPRRAQTRSAQTRSPQPRSPQPRRQGLAGRQAGPGQLRPAPGQDRAAGGPLRRHSARVLPVVLLAAQVTGSLLLPAGTAPVSAAAFIGSSATPVNQFTGAATFPTYPQAVAADNPLVYYRQDDASGSATAADSSGNGSTAPYFSPTGTYRLVAGSPAGGAGAGANAALRFPGSGNATAHSNALVTSPNLFTIEVWIKSASASASRFFGFGENTYNNSYLTDRYLVLQTDGRVTFFVGGTFIHSPSGGYNDGDWHLVTASLGASGMQLYIDGALVVSNGSITTGQNYSGYWRIGGDNLYLDGSLDEAAVYLSQLSGAAVAAHYAAGIGAATLSAYTTAVKADSPWALWHLDDVQSPPFTETTYATTMADASGQNHPGTYRLLYPAGMTAGGPGALTGVESGSTSVKFTGSGYAIVPTAYVNPVTFSLECWFRTTSTLGGKLIGFGNASTGFSTSYDRHIYLRNDGKVAFGIYLGATRTVTSPGAVNNGAWHHVVATDGAGGIRLYLDGALAAADPASSGGQAYTGYWRWGGDKLTSWPSAPTSFFFTGDLDEVAIYGTQLSAQQVAWHYHANH